MAGTDGIAGLHVRFDENGNLLGSDDDPLTGSYTHYKDIVVDAADNIYFVGGAQGATAANVEGYVRWGGVVAHPGDTPRFIN